MRHAQGKRHKIVNTKPKTIGPKDEPQTRTLSKRELAQMFEQAEGELRTPPQDSVLELQPFTGRTDEDLTPLPFSIVHFENAPTPPSLFNVPQEDALHGLAFNTDRHGMLCSLQQLKKATYIEEDTQPSVLIATSAQQSPKIPSPKPPRNLLLLGMLIGLWVGGLLFMLLYGLLLNAKPL